MELSGESSLLEGDGAAGIWYSSSVPRVALEEVYQMARKALDASALRSHLQKQLIATLGDLKTELGTSSTMTVFRKLKELGYLTSYSHRGKYYTLRDIPHFDELGLWSSGSVWFSISGNLLETTCRFVDETEAGFTAAELQRLLHVGVKEPLLKLYRQKRIDRQEVDGEYVYLSREKGRKRNQRLTREGRMVPVEIGHSPLREALSQELNAAIILFFSLLDEKQRRLYAGLESHKIGHGGDRKVAQVLALDVHTVARGRHELFASDVERERVRKEGGGRKRVEKKRPK